MCGRYLRRSDKQRIAEAFRVGMGLEELCLEPDDDIAPGSIQPVVVTSETGEREIALMRWGFKLPDRHLFTARSEGIDQSKFWKDSFQQRRCIVPADAIFEWQQVERGRKKPKFEVVIPGREPFGIAGVWKPWKNPKTNQWEQAFAVITGEPNELIQPIHHRLTKILDPQDYEEYLSKEDRSPVHLLRVPPAEEMCAIRIEESETTDPQLGLFNTDRE
jgi:putative SOS response-associated peptidase YedK